MTHCKHLNYRAGSKARSALSYFLSAAHYATDLVGVCQIGVGTDMSTGAYPDGELIRSLPGKEGVTSVYSKFIEVAPKSKLCDAGALDDYGQLPLVVEAFSNPSYDEPATSKVLGGNFLLLFKQVGQ